VTLLIGEVLGVGGGTFAGPYGDRWGGGGRAHRGTLLMDEVCEMGLRMQGLLLRFLETGDIQPVGSDRPAAELDVRIIAATNLDPFELVRSKTFREDLYYRLNVIDIVIPPLRERREDIPLLFEHFLREFSGQRGTPVPSMAPDAVKWITEHEWPGNVRQLRNTVERMIVRCRGGVVTADHLANRKEPVATPRVALGAPLPLAAAAAAVETPRTHADAVYDRMVKQRESFWTAVHASYMVRDLTRKDVRAIVTRGLHETAGNYKMLVELFNMDRGDYNRFLNFLRKHDCQLPFADFRAVKSWHRDLPDGRLRNMHTTAAPQIHH
jgi:DNA-binding NtrC family response regulator